MTNEKMTVHQALCELKTLDARIDKAIGGAVFAYANKHSNTKVCGLPIEKYNEEVKSEYQSANDLIARRDAIKRAVVLSNATTRITVGGREYTVAEAIEMKNNGIPILNKLLKKLDTDSRRARRDADVNNGEALETRADEYVKSLYASADMKNLSEDIKRVRSEFITSQAVEIVDPININGEMEKLEKRINEFTVGIDSALSVSNALTEISVDY